MVTVGLESNLVGLTGEITIVDEILGQFAEGDFISV